MREEIFILRCYNKDCPMYYRHCENYKNCKYWIERPEYPKYLEVGISKEEFEVRQAFETKQQTAGGCQNAK